MATEPEVVTVTVEAAVVVGLVVDAAVMVTLVADAGAVYVVVAPLAVCAGLKDPQDPAGAQLQSTSPFAVSLETVAEMVAVPLAAIDFGGACVRAIEIVPEGCEFESDPPAPHPDRPTARNRRVILANISNVHVARDFSTTAS